LRGSVLAAQDITAAWNQSSSAVSDDGRDAIVGDSRVER
jgi:hypothetical protein